MHSKNKKDQVKCELNSSRWIDTNKSGKGRKKIKGGLIVILVASKMPGSVGKEEFMGGVLEAPGREAHFLGTE